MLSQPTWQPRPFSFYKAGNICNGISGFVDFNTSTAWTAGNCVVTQNSGFPAPDGSSRYRVARLIEDNTAGAGHLISYDGTSITVVAGQKYHVGFFFRRNTNSTNVRNIQPKFFDSTYGDQCLDSILYTGLISASSPGGTLITQSAHNTWPVGNGWVQTEQTVATTSATNIKFYISLLDSGLSATFNGDSVSGYDLWNPYVVLVGA